MDGLGFFYPKYHLEESRVCKIPLNYFALESQSSFLQDLAPKSKPHTNFLTFSHKTLASLSISGLQMFLHKWEVSKTKCGLILLIHYKAMFGTSLNPISHFWDFSHLLVFISLSFLI